MGSAAKSLVLATDIGSSSLRTALFTERGTRLVESSASRQYRIGYTPDGGAELAPSLLLAAAKRCVAETLRARSGNLPIIAVAGSAFWHSLVGLDHRGSPITPVFTWADSRGALDAAKLRRKLSERKIQLRTGCVLRAPYWPAKLRWLRRINPKLFRRVASWVSPAAWIYGELFGIPLTSHSMASGTGLYNLVRREWDSELCDFCEVSLEQLGHISDLTPDAPAVQKELAGAAIFSALGDGAASNLGSGADRSGKVAINIGTSAAVRTVVGKSESRSHQLPAGLFRYVVDEERVLLGGASSNGGNLRQWCLRELHLRDKKAAEKALSRVAAAIDNLTILPFWVGERAPTWPEDLRGTITGLTPRSSAADILRAAMTSTYYRLAGILDVLESAVPRTEEIIISGGVLHSRVSLKILADSLGRDIRVCTELESSLRGAATYSLRNLGYAPASLQRGELVRHRPALAEQHRARRAQQDALERLLLASQHPLGVG